ncbi:unnamed protein product, partial [marine sediment metagenome]
MWLVRVIVNILYWIYRFFYDIAETCWDTFVIPDRIGDWFMDLAWYFYDLRSEVEGIGRWFEEVKSSLWDILSWDTISEKIKSAFFDWKSPWAWFFDTFWNVVDSYFPWLRTTLFDSWWDFIAKLDITIPTWDNFMEPARTWLWSFIDTYFPWLRDPKASVWGWFWDYVDTYFPWARDPETTVWDWVKDKITERFPVLKDLDFDPIGWLTEKMADALGAFLGVAAWPFLH